MSSKEKKPQQIRITNKRASFDYEFLEEYDAGIVLVGTEIKSTAISRTGSSTCAA